jgi:hypothetical protein
MRDLLSTESLEELRGEDQLGRAKAEAERSRQHHGTPAGVFGGQTRSAEEEGRTFRALATDQGVGQYYLALGS